MDIQHYTEAKLIEGEVFYHLMEYASWCEDRDQPDNEWGSCAYLQRTTVLDMSTDKEVIENQLKQINQEKKEANRQKEIERTFVEQEQDDKRPRRPWWQIVFVS